MGLKDGRNAIDTCLLDRTWMTAVTNYTGSKKRGERKKEERKDMTKANRELF